MPEPMIGVRSTASATELEEDEAFWNQLLVDIETPLEGGEAIASHRDILAKLESHKDQVTKADLYELDRIALEMASDEEVKARARGLYQRYCQERGQTLDPNDPALKPLPPGDGHKAEMMALRARMLEILRALHWSYTFGPIREKLRVRLMKEAMLVMIAATVLMGALIAVFRGMAQPFLAMLVAVVYAGVMGGAISCARRLGTVSTTDDALGSIYALKNSHYALVFAPITGAVFAVVTMLLFMGKVLTGLLFPTFTGLETSGPVVGGWQFTHGVLPSNSSAYALLFLWCFIAGFAERFIPDTLDSLTKRAAAPKTESPKPAPAS